ncbi:hypothetical protein Cgig2_027196 [Carnegiea gigantea]|uniref:Uncharacterized protein n=1 Tax=Carnegiea gigantea TaxID=171969 RepID=A0A9Q1KT30_9CARY|nr:hypothetical protein Cgig2_027196 [Carnegiea gigantea]
MHLACGSFTVASALRITKWVGASGNSGSSATISATNPSGARPFLLSTDLPGADGPSGDEALVDAPSKDELLELELVEATSTSGLDGDRAKQGLPCVPSARNSSRDLMRGIDLAFAILRTWKSGYVTSTFGLRTLGVEEYSQLDHKGGHRIGNLFGFPTLILLGDADHRLAIDKGREAREFWVAGPPLRCWPTLQEHPHWMSKTVT